MKRFLFIITLFSAVVSFGQSFNGGLVFGLCASHTTGSFVDPVTYDEEATFNRSFSKPGINAGVFTNLYFTDNQAIDFEISFIQKGARKVPNKNDTLSGQVYESTLRLNYITIPIHYKYELSNYFSAFAGPNIGLLLSHSYTQNYIDQSYILKFNRFDFSVDIGVVVKLLARLSLDVKYSATFFLLPIRSYNNPDSWSYGPFAKQFWQRGQCNQLLDFTLRWTLFGSKDKLTN